jgi:hypothetical protein
MRNAYLTYLKIGMVRSGHGTCYFLEVNMQERESSVCRLVVRERRRSCRIVSESAHAARPRAPPFHVIRRFYPPFENFHMLLGICIPSGVRQYRP